MASQTLLIVNPASGGGLAGRLADGLVARAEAICGPLSVATTRAPGDAAAIAREAAARGIARVLVAGGDGTTGEVVTGLIEGARTGSSRPALGILPVGSGCDLARTLGLPRRIEAALEIVASGNTRSLDVGRVELRDAAGGPCVRHFANEVSAGLSGDTLRHVGPLSARVGPRLGFFAGALAAVASHAPFEAVVRVDGERVHEGAVSLVAVANGCYFGAGMRVAPEARVDDGLLEVVLARGLSRRELVTHLPAFYLGRHGRHPRVSFHAAHRVEVLAAAAPPGAPAAPVAGLAGAAVEIDGEGGFGLPLRAECLPGALRVFAPEVTIPVLRPKRAVVAPLVSQPVAVRRQRG
ncbi:MAG: diacylglycerol kinase family protein [Myxococcota bacterium]